VGTEQSTAASASRLEGNSNAPEESRQRIDADSQPHSKSCNETAEKLTQASKTCLLQGCQQLAVTAVLPTNQACRPFGQQRTTSTNNQQLFT
jgi:hypothetical protein